MNMEFIYMKPALKMPACEEIVPRNGRPTLRSPAVWADTTRPYPVGQEGVQSNGGYEFPSRIRTGNYFIRGHKRVCR
jgi:hypothetical protein